MLKTNDYSKTETMIISKQQSIRLAAALRTWSSEPSPDQFDEWYDRVMSQLDAIDLPDMKDVVRQVRYNISTTWKIGDSAIDQESIYLPNTAKPLDGTLFRLLLLHVSRPDDLLTGSILATIPEKSFITAVH